MTSSDKHLPLRQRAPTPNGARAALPNWRLSSSSSADAPRKDDYYGCVIFIRRIMRLLLHPFLFCFWRIGNSTFNESEHIATHRPASNPTSSNSSEKNAEDSVTQPISKDTENSSRRRNNRKHRNNKEVTTVQPAQPADHRTEAEASIPSESGGRKEMNKNTSRRRGGRRKSNNKHRRNKKPENRSKSRDKTRKTKNSPKRKSNKNNKKKKIKSSNNNRRSQERQRTSAGNRARSLEPEHWSHIAPIFSPSEKDEVKHGFGEVRDQDQLSSSFNRYSWLHTNACNQVFSLFKQSGIFLWQKSKVLCSNIRRKRDTNHGKSRRRELLCQNTQKPVLRPANCLRCNGTSTITWGNTIVTTNKYQS